MRARTDGGAGEKLVGVEVLRFAAAFSVLVWHYQHFFPTDGFAPERQPFFALLEPFYRQGYWGVNLFWCISGFIFAWKYGTEIGAGAVSFRRFVTLRFSRLYPLHLLTLVSVALLQILHFSRHGAYFIYAFNDFRHFALNLAFASYWGLQDGMSFNGPSWSISAEILVYLLFFGCCRLVGTRARLALPMTFGVFLLAAVAQARLGTSFAVLLVVNFFCLGVLACQLCRMIEAQRLVARVVFGAVAGTLALGSLTLAGLGVMTVEAVSLVLCPSLVLLVQIVVPDCYPRVNRCLTFLGDLTYASYMLQFPAQLAAVMVIEATGARLADLATTHEFFLVYVLGVAVLSRLVLVTVERPAQAMLREVLLRSPVLGRRREAPTAV